MPAVVSAGAASRARPSKTDENDSEDAVSGVL